jgi:hypothetical protein
VAADVVAAVAAAEARDSGLEDEEEEGIASSRRRIFDPGGKY